MTERQRPIGTNRERLRQAAFDYAARKLPVFPCVPLEKIPATKRGFYDATTNPATIDRWWSAQPYNIAIPTGAASGFWVLDTDSKRDGEASLRALEAVHGPLPPTPQVITVQGGRHDWFKYTGSIPCSTDKIAPGLDVRGDGGYVMVPPSIWKNGRAYAWSVDSYDQLPTAPDWLVELARKKPTGSISERALEAIRTPRGSARPSDAYGQAALDREIEALAGTAPGSRNHALNRCAFRLFQLVAGGELDRDPVIERLTEACDRNGLIKDDGLRSVVATIRSGARAGLQHPRSRSGAA